MLINCASYAGRGEYMSLLILKLVDLSIQHQFFTSETLMYYAVFLQTMGDYLGSKRFASLGLRTIAQQDDGRQHDHENTKAHYTTAIAFSVYRQYLECSNDIDKQQVREENNHSLGAALKSATLAGDTVGSVMVLESSQHRTTDLTGKVMDMVTFEQESCADGNNLSLFVLASLHSN